jgi:hypothetical protein
MHYYGLEPFSHYSEGSQRVRTHEDSEGSVVYATEYHGWIVTHP